MKAIILAPRRGHRFGDLTHDIPKCLLKFGQESILKRSIRLLLEVGFAEEDIIVVAGYRAGKVQEELFETDIKIINNKNYFNTELSYSLGMALDDLDDDIVVIEGDVIFEKEALGQLLNSAGNKLLVKEEEYLFEGDRVVTSAYNGKVLAIGKHLQNEIFLYKNIFRVEREYVDLIKTTLIDPKNIKIGYPVLLNRLLNKIKFEILISQKKIFQVKTLTELIYAKSKFGISDYRLILTDFYSPLKKSIWNSLKEEYLIISSEKDNKDKGIFLNPLNMDQAREYISRYRPDAIIHIVDLQDKQSQVENIGIVKNLSVLCKEFKIRLVFIYTAEVEYSNFLNLSDKIAANCLESLTIRIPNLYGNFKSCLFQSFPSQVIQLLKEDKTIELDDKLEKAPVLIDEVALALNKVFLQSGFICLESDLEVTDYKWARIIAKEFKLDIKLITRQNKKSPLSSSRQVFNQDEKNKGNYKKLKKYKFSNIYEGTKILNNQINCAFNLIYQSMPIENIFGVNVGEFRHKLGYDLGRKLKSHLYDKIDYVVPVPNSGLYYAMGMAEGLEKPYLQSLIKPDAAARSFHIKDISLREEIIYKKIFPIKELIKDKRLLLVDEAIFTGTTLCVVCDMVRACGAKSIYIAIPTPVTKNPCNQYILPKRKLLSEFINIDEIKDYFKVDDIFFQKSENFYKSIKGIKNLCHECFDK